MTGLVFSAKTAKEFCMSEFFELEGGERGDGFLLEQVNGHLTTIFSDPKRVAEFPTSQHMVTTPAVNIVCV